MAPILISACTLNHAKTPTTNRRLKSSGARSAIRVKRANNPPNSPSNTAHPTKPNISAYIEKIESLAASGTHPFACTLLPSPTPNMPPEPTPIIAWHSW